MRGVLTAPTGKLVRTHIDAVDRGLGSDLGGLAGEFEARVRDVEMESPPIAAPAPIAPPVWMPLSPQGVISSFPHRVCKALFTNGSMLGSGIAWVGSRSQFAKHTPDVPPSLNSTSLDPKVPSSSR